MGVPDGSAVAGAEPEAEFERGCLNPGRVGGIIPA